MVQTLKAEHSWLLDVILLCENRTSVAHIFGAQRLALLELNRAKSEPLAEPNEMYLRMVQYGVLLKYLDGPVPSLVSLCLKIRWSNLRFSIMNYPFISVLLNSCPE